MFRPCIDLHEGKVKQIVGGSLTDRGDSLRTNFVSDKPSAWFAELYRKDNLGGGHIIMLGPGNEAAARSALQSFPGGMQIGGGIRPENALTFLEAGASHVIVTSWIFPQGKLDLNRLKMLSALVGANRLVIDLSCRKKDGKYFVVTDRWQQFTEVTVEAGTMSALADYCAEFLVHGVDVEGLRAGVDLALVELISAASPIAVTYAGGARSLQDLVLVTERSGGRVDLTIGSALDIFGGSGVRYRDVVEYNQKIRAPGADFGR